MKKPKPTKETYIEPGVTGKQLMAGKQYEPAERTWRKPKQKAKRPEKIKYDLF